MRKILTGCVLLLAASGATAQILECVDAKGNKSVAQFCPPGTVKENKLMKGGAGPGPTAAPGTAAPAKSVSDRDAEFKKRTQDRQEAEAKAAKEKSDSRESEKNCLDARAQLRALQDGQRIARTDPKTGERVVLEDNDRPAEIAAAQKSVDQWCNKK